MATVFSKQEKDNLVSTCIQSTAVMFKYTMGIIGVENYIKGTVEFDGVKYDVLFKRQDYNLDAAKKNG